MKAGYVLLIAGAIVLLGMFIVFYSPYIAAAVGGCVAWACGAGTTIWSGANKAIKILESERTGDAG